MPRPYCPASIVNQPEFIQHSQAVAIESTESKYIPSRSSNNSMSPRLIVWETRWLCESADIGPGGQTVSGQAGSLRCVVSTKVCLRITFTVVRLVHRDVVTHLRWPRTCALIYPDSGAHDTPGWY